jgi:tagatose 1,6-diphosphate aldolase
MAFVFLAPGPLRDGDLELRLRHTSPGVPEGPWAPSYHFDMIHLPTNEKAGAIDLRVGNFPSLVLYGGHIGYSVDPAFRGRHYAARAVRLLLDLARRHEMPTVWITCNPDNLASRRTCELAGGKLLEIVDLPPDNEMYLEGERQKCRYRFDLKAG